jgi:4-amino-4-deoxy-L-arabinose transferase-like glycosyltransferase
VLGAAITLLLFFIGWRISNRGWFAALVALAHTLNLGQLFFESNLLTETLATFFVVLSLAGTLIWLTQPTQRGIWLAFGIGLTSSLALITRPQFIYLPFWIFPFLAVKYKAGSPSNLRVSLSIYWAWAFAFLVPVFLIIGSWVGFIRTRFGDWGLTTMTGYHLVQHTGDYFQYVPDEHALLRDIYLTYRDDHIARFGTQANTIWEAIPAMQAASGLSFYDLSRTLARISTPDPGTPHAIFEECA